MSVPESSDPYSSILPNAYRCNDCAFTTADVGLAASHVASTGHSHGVPKDWYRDAPPRTTGQLFIRALTAGRQARFDANQRAWNLIEAAWDRIEGEWRGGVVDRDAFLAALRAELAKRGLTD